MQAVFKGRTVAIRIRKGDKHQLGLFFLLEACQRNAAGWSTAAIQRTQSFHFPIVIHQSLDPAARSSAQAPSSLSLHALRALDSLGTGRRVGLPAVEVVARFLQHVILAKKPYERCLRGAVPVLFVILVRKPRKLGPRYGLSTFT